MAGKAEKFLSLYKEYETLVRSMYSREPKDLEDEFPDPRQGRLRMCRQFRNYLSHQEDPGFLEPTDKMLKFLGERVSDLKSEKDVVRKHLKKPEVCMVMENAKASEAWEKFIKLECLVLPVVYKDGRYGMLSVFDVMGVRGTTKVNTLKIKPVKPLYCGPLQLFKDLDMDAFYLCTSDGTPDGKLLGKVWTKDGGGIL